MVKKLFITLLALAGGYGLFLAIMDRHQRHVVWHEVTDSVDHS
ncbi:hypothetical protein [Trueperella sp. LYQ143]